MRVFLLALLVLGLSLLGRGALAHEADLNNRVTFFVTGLRLTEVQGEEALELTAVFDNGLRNRVTLREMSSTAGAQVRLYGIRDFSGVEILVPKRTFALRSGSGVEFARPDYILMITGLSPEARSRQPFDLRLVFNRAVGEMTVPITFEINADLEHGRGVIDLGPPAALQQDYVWLSAEGEPVPDSDAL